MKKINPTSLFVRIWAALNQRHPWPYVYILVDASFWWRHVINIFIPLLLSNLFSLSFSSLEKAALLRFLFFLNLLVSDAGWMPTVSHMLLEQVLPRKAFCYWLGGSSAASAWCHWLLGFSLNGDLPFSVLCSVSPGVSLLSFFQCLVVPNSNGRRKEAKITHPQVYSVFGRFISVLEFLQWLQ